MESLRSNSTPRKKSAHADSTTKPSEAADAVAAALDHADGPELIDVAIDTEEPSVKQVADYESTVDLG